MAKVQLTITCTYDVDHTAPGYEDCKTLADAIALDLEMLEDSSMDPGELLCYADDITYELTPVASE